MREQTFTYIFIFALLLSIIACGDGQKVETETVGTSSSKSEAATVDSFFKTTPEIDRLTKLITADTTNAELYFTRANMYLQAKQLEQAAVDFADAIIYDSTNATYYLAMADMYFNARELPASIAILNKGLKTLPNNVQMHLDVGKYYYYMGQYPDSQKHLGYAVSKDEENADAYFWMAMGAKDKEQFDEAIRLLEKATKYDPEFYNAQMMLGQFYARQKNKKAVDAYEHALKIDAASIEAHYGKAMFLQENGSKEEAIAEYKKIIAKDPQNKDAFYNIGYIYFDQAQYKEARDQFNIVCRVDPAYAKAYYMRGACTEKMGDKKGAAIDYKRTLNFDPDFELALKGLQRVEMKDKE